MDALRATIRRHPALTGAFVLAAALVLWLLVEVTSGVLGWHGRGEEPLAPWMTIGYVGRTHEVDPRLIDVTAGFPTPDEAGHPLTLAEIAQRQGIPIGQVYDKVEAALVDLRPPQGHHGEDAPIPLPAPTDLAPSDDAPATTGAAP